MNEARSKRSLRETVSEIRKLLPIQAPLKDFISQNSLQAFQGHSFHEGLKRARATLSIQTYLAPEDYLQRFKKGQIDETVIRWVIENRFSKEEERLAFHSLIFGFLNESTSSLSEQSETPTNRLRDLWKSQYHLDVISHVQPILFRHLGHFLDQGISFSSMPFQELGFWEALKKINQESVFSLFRLRNGRASSWLGQDPWTALEQSLDFLVGYPAFFEQYLFEMVQEHPGWSGLVSVLEDKPEHLHFPRTIYFHEALAFELLLEVDYIEKRLLAKKKRLKPLAELYCTPAAEEPMSEPSSYQESLIVLHEALEWTHYRSLLTALHFSPLSPPATSPSIQALFCVDDRSCSLRRYLEEVLPDIETFGTPGFFGVEFFYQGIHDRFPVKLCPAPLSPHTLIREEAPAGSHLKRETDVLLSSVTHTFLKGWLISQTLGLVSAVKLMFNIFRPTLTPSVASSFKHTQEKTGFKYLRHSDTEKDGGLFLGFTRNEMADRVQSLLGSIGLIGHFSSLIAVIGHGSSTVNNPHYAAYDCGACSGRPGSINARILCSMANDIQVRALLDQRGVHIPESTRFVAGLHDTTRDDITFYDTSTLDAEHHRLLAQLRLAFREALDRNSKERSRRFLSIPLGTDKHKAHQLLRRKSVSIFEPRQEFTHATNSSCIVAPRTRTRNIFLDRRAFLNSYVPSTDPQGDILANILKAAVPVCGGINLQYFWSKVDNEKLGAGTKLPHNVVGLFSVANGTEGDLRPGLPLQMIEWHEPVRLILVVEQEPAIALKAAQQIPATYEWIHNEWIRYACISPSTQEVFVFSKGHMNRFDFFEDCPPSISELKALVESSRDNLPIHIITGDKV
ncbi:MAG: DUF2309 domain-containing protein [Proteobacteria bacterium]|nr:DUF2309 domain-containing protein [Pseudomonadota bacterium]NDC23041.1 DUF2309 domain-containing protein [Pseudomonadota bacterium]NDD03312.1 DUF2309 domain-containing protein [Pseudomonadota bacterium]NDG25936.1 DUF2309 domain-containing protein [Pseudomonadota bacterium]